MKDTEISRYPSIVLIVRGLLIRHLFQCPRLDSGAFFVVTVSNRDMYTFVVGCVETDGADTNLFNELRVFLNEMVTVSSVDS